ncbi:hypothetical protein E2562_037441 [Oryza meyeriana var. granulata]|uniref:Exportin-1/Importin-beta-like domain-containing protein n=1 Tax=Oryza meyeriana var. granulata TaxID=110450 RepID=A0A6G1FGG3_9ORYZ|nr:hypothetical protein E2562_037441 [Oryza meyeriana var. granulata]
MAFLIFIGKEVTKPTLRHSPLQFRSSRLPPSNLPKSQILTRQAETPATGHPHTASSQAFSPYPPPPRRCRHAGGRRVALSAGDVPLIYSVLANSLSADSDTRQPAEALLAQCETRQGFCSCLLVIITSRGDASDDNVRLLAAELSRGRLAFDQRNYSETTAHLFDYIWNLWKSNAQIVLQNFSAISQHNSILDQSNDLLLICERWLVCLKIIRQLICSGYASDSTTMQEVCQVKEVCPVLLGAIQSILPYCSIFKETQARLWGHAKRACIKLMKVLIALQDRHPCSFAHETVLPVVVDFCLTMITNPEQADTPFEEFLVQCMVLVKLVLESQEYKPGRTGHAAIGSSEHASFDQINNNLSATASSMVVSVLPADRIMLLCNILIRRYYSELLSTHMP